MAQQSEVFRDSIGHPSDPVTLLNAHLHFSVLYQRSPVGLPVPGILKNTRNAQWRENSEAKSLKLQELAWDLVSHYPPGGIATEAEEPDAGENSENVDE